MRPQVAAWAAVAIRQIVEQSPRGSRPCPHRCRSVRHDRHRPGARARIEPLAGGQRARIVVGAALLVLVALARGPPRELGGRPPARAGRRGLRRRSTRRASSRPWRTPAWRSARSWRSARRPRSPVSLAAPSPASGSSGRWAAATGLACAGVCLLVLGGSSGGEVSLPGVGLALAAGAGYAGYAVIGKRMLDTGGTPEGVMAAVFATGAAAAAAARAGPHGELLSRERPGACGLSRSVPTAPRLHPVRRGPRAHRSGRDRDAHARRAGHGGGARRAVLGERPGPRRSPARRSCWPGSRCWRCARAPRRACAPGRGGARLSREHARNRW